MKSRKTNTASPRNRSSQQCGVVQQRVARPRLETPLQEISRMQRIASHYRKLSKVSRDYVLGLMDRRLWHDLPEEAA